METCKFCGKVMDENYFCPDPECNISLHINEYPLVPEECSKPEPTWENTNNKIDD